MKWVLLIPKFKASFECFRFFRSENLKIWKSWRRHFSSENLKIWKIAAADCANWKSEITTRFSVFQIGMILIANLKKFLQIFSFSDDHVWVQSENWRHKSETARKPHTSENLKSARLKHAFLNFWKHAHFLNFRFSDLKNLKHSNKALKVSFLFGDSRVRVTSLHNEVQCS